MPNINPEILQPPLSMFPACCQQILQTFAPCRGTTPPTKVTGRMLRLGLRGSSPQQILRDTGSPAPDITEHGFPDVRKSRRTDRQTDRHWPNHVHGRRPPCGLRTTDGPRPATVPGSMMLKTSSGKTFCTPRRTRCRARRTDPMEAADDGNGEPSCRSADIVVA